MLTDSTAVRGLPWGTLDKYRLLAAQLVKEQGQMVSMNSLYIQALEEFIKKPANKKLVEK